jgi:hypothetical protein
MPLSRRRPAQPLPAGDAALSRSIAGPRLLVVATGIGIGLAMSAGDAPGQELEPRAYSPAPVGANILLATYGRTTGGVVFDESLPFTDVDARLSASAIGYVRTLDVFGRSASVGAVLPYVWGEVRGNVGEQFQRVTRSGLGDLRARVVVNVLGGPALTPAVFAQRKPRTTLGASLIIAAPSGQYDPSKLINIGGNRWAFKPELGLSKPLGRLTAEIYAAIWLFTDNQDFYGGQRREQDPLGAFQGHVSYTFKPRLWLAANATFYTGGRTSLDGVPKADLQRNTRLGATLSVPVGRRQSIKVAWASGIITRIGGDFDTLSAAWQITWF